MANSFYSESETDFQYFMDKVKKHEYVVDNDEAKPIIIKALSFLYELDEIGKREIEVERIFSIAETFTKKIFFLFLYINRFTLRPSLFLGYHKT